VSKFFVHLAKYDLDLIISAYISSRKIFTPKWGGVQGIKAP
jgi:hypothetical protein